MPYIKQERREHFKDIDNAFKFKQDTDIIFMKGDLTYCAYKLAKQFIKVKGKNYQNISDAISALEDAAHEIRRRILNPYEDEKIKENGEV